MSFPIDYQKEAEKIEKNYQYLVKVRKTAVLEDIRTIVERIEEHRKVQGEAIKDAEDQCNRLQSQHSQMESMKEQMPIFKKKIKEAERQLSEKDQLLSILLKHPNFQIEFVQKYEYNVKIRGENETRCPSFLAARTENGVKYIPKYGFPRDFPAYLLEPAELSLSDFKGQCEEIDNLLS